MDDNVSFFTALRDINVKFLSVDQYLKKPFFSFQKKKTPKKNSFLDNSTVVTVNNNKISLINDAPFVSSSVPKTKADKKFVIGGESNFVSLLRE